MIIRNRLFFSAALIAAEFFFARCALATYAVSFIPVATNAYGADDVNSNGIVRNNLVTLDGYQFIAYYIYDSNGEGTIELARRAVGSTTWTYDNTGITVSNTSDSIVSGAIDDHLDIAMAVDGNGDMHLSWGMHNNTLNYDISSNSVIGSSFAPAFVKQTSTNNPALFSQLHSVDQVTYPEFYYVPGTNGSPSGNLLFEYRDAASASGGGSGNGNNFFSIYTGSSKSFANPEEVLNGGLTSVNGYYNSMVYDSNGNLLTSWTWRGTSAYQTNMNVMFAQSPDNGVTWYQQGGTTQYSLPIISSTADGGSAAQVAQVVLNIPENNSLINQTYMTVDTSNNPVIATWWTPDGNASEAVSASNNPNRQYMLVYYTGTQWKDSTITDRTSDTSFDTSGNDVRDLGRPIVVVDSSDRVLVITRSEDTAIGDARNPSTPDNDIVIYWNTMASLDSSRPQPWQSITLDTANMGEYEPTYDPTLWSADNILDLFYEPVGLTGETTGDLQILQWNEHAYFNPILGDANGDGVVGAADLAILNQYAGQSVTGGYSDGDFNNDGVVNADDYALFMEGLAEYNAGLTTAPEPAALALLLPFSVMLLRKR